MFSYKTQRELVHKKKQALRRLSQTGRPSQTAGRTRNSSTSSSSSPSRVRERTREEEGSVPINPFLAALKTANPPPAASSNNVFLQQAASIVTRQQGDDEEEDDDEPVDEVTMLTSRPLSYAGAVKSNVPRPGVNPFLAAQSGSTPSSQSLHLKGVPDHLNNKQFLWQHFEKFGPLNDVNCHPEKKYADIHFKTQRGAILAKSNGKFLSDNAPPLSIFWFSDKTKGRGATAHSMAHRLGPVQQPPPPPPPPPTSPPKRPVLPPSPRKGPVKGEEVRDDEVRLKPPTIIKHIEEEEEYIPTHYDIENEEEIEKEDEMLNEGVNEGRDSILTEQPFPEDDSKMDTIARVPKHKYYLRSIYQPESSSDTGGGGGGSSSEVKKKKAGPATASFSSRVPPLSADTRRGQTALERFEALDARDKEIRKSIIKDTSLSAKAKSGSCPDMCPEKERYQREYQRRLSIFEIDTTCSEMETGQGPRVNHLLAIKEYSRSAADKEEPLPHELRPLPVLTMTMDHIVTVVMDAGEGHVSEWYNFIWDRTRAITTDITYQQLCHSDCVHLLEQFARFHIMCSHVLCEEELSVFDPKMNAETLSNHLQSLRQLYKDLRQEQGISCKNEAEFCSYDILLHLNDGNVFNKVEQYSHSIRRSSEVQFAISVVQCVDSNNFVRFFKLVKKATYLSSCLLNPHFDLVRWRALKTLNNSHSPGKTTPMHFLLTDLTRMLEFSSDDEADEFCKYFGFNVLKDKVQFQRGHEIEDLGPAGLRYDNHLISSKDANKSYGEIVYGGPLPPRPNHTPTCSFTGNNTTTVQPPIPAVDEEVVQSLATVIERSVITEEIRAISIDIIKEVEKNEFIVSICTDTLNKLMSDVIVSYCTEISEQVLVEQMKERELRDREELKSILSLEFTQQILSDTLRDESMVLAAEAIADAQLDLEAFRGALECIVSELVESVLVEMVKESAQDSILISKKERRQRLARIGLQLKKWRLQQYWRKWRRCLERRRYIQLAVSTFPSSGPLIPLSSQMSIISPSSSSSPKRRRVEEPLPTPSVTLIPRQDFICPIDYSSLSLSGPQCTRTHWNLLLVNGAAAPPHVVGVEHQLMWEWLANKLGYVRQQNDGVESVCYSLHNKSTLDVSIKVVTVGEINHQLNNNIKLVSSVLLYLPWTAPPECYTEYVVGVVSDVTRSLVPYAPVPLVILTPSTLSFLHRIHLSQGMDSHHWPHFSQLIVHPLAETDNWKQNESKLFRLVEWCLNSSPSLPPVQWMSSEKYITEGLNDHFIKPLLADCQVRTNTGLPSQDPVLIVQLYDSVLDYLLQRISTRPTFTSLPVTLSNTSNTNTPPYWTPPQTDAVDNFQYILSFLRLPNPQDLHTKNPPDYMSNCLDYVRTINDDYLLISRIKSLLLRHTHSFIPWSHMILICVQHLLLRSSTHMDRVSVGIPSVRQEGEGFTPPLEWRVAAVDSLMATAERGRESQQKEERRTIRKRRFSDPLSHLSSSLKKPKSLRLSLGGADPTPSDHMTGLTVTLEYEKAAALEFEEQLQRLLSMNPTQDDTATGATRHYSAQSSTLSSHNKSLNECMDSLENEISTLRWREKLDYVSLMENTL